MRRPQPNDGDQRPWMELEDAAERLGTNGRALRKRLYRADVQRIDGAAEVTMDGNVYRKLGGRWKVRLGARWWS